MENVMSFAFESQKIRTVYFPDDMSAWFVGKDACDLLGYKDPTTAMRSHCRGVQKLHPLQTPGGMQELRIINLPDTLRLIANSTLPAAQRIEAWMFEEVLPTVLKTGTYTVPGRETQPEPAPIVENTCRYYPFFDGSTFTERTEFMKWLLAEDLVSREELPRKVFYHGLPASPGPSAAGQAIRTQEALIAGRRRKLNPLVLGFAENFLDITGLEDDFILIHEAYNAFKDATGSNTTRNVFVRQLKDIDSRIVNKQKKINGVPLPAFFGVKFREKFQS